MHVSINMEATSQVDSLDGRVDGSSRPVVSFSSCETAMNTKVVDRDGLVSVTIFSLVLIPRIGILTSLGIAVPLAFHEMDVLSPPPDGDRNRAAALLSIIWISYAFALMLMIARVYVRFRSKKLGMDDYLMVFAMVILIISEHADLLILKDSVYDSKWADYCYD